LHHPEPLVLSGHLEEVPQPLEEYLRSPPGCVDPADPDLELPLRVALVIEDVRDPRQAS